MLSKQYWSKLLLFGFLALLLGLFVGCGNNSEDFVFTTNTGNTISNPTQPTTFNLSVSTDPAVLARTLPALGRLIPITQVRIIVFNPAGTRVGEQLVAANVTAVFPLPRGQYLVRVEFLTAGNVVIGYFDRYLTLAGDAVEVIRGIRITNTPPTPNPSDPGDPFLAFTSTPDTAAEGAEFLASAQVYTAEGELSTTVTTGVSLTSNGVALDGAVADQDTSQTGGVTFSGLKFPTDASGTATLVVSADGVESASSEPIEVSAAPLPFFTTLERNSVDSTGVEGNLASRNAGSSADGRFIAFQSDANNLVPNDNNNTSDIFVKDRTNGSIERVSVGDGGVESNGFSSTFSAPGLSDDGRFVAFASEASNLVPNDNNGASDVFVFDRTNDTIELVSRATGGAQGDRTSDSPSISADGRFVTFRSQSTNFAPGVNVQNDHHIFVFDRNSDTIQRISQEANGTIGNSFNSQPTISADGRFVAFSSAATNLVANDTNGAVQDVFVYDRTNNVMDLVSVDNGGTQGNSGSNQPDISVDGRFVTFGSFATNLVADDTTSNLEAFVRDRTNNTTERVALGPAGVEANAGSSASQISDDGRFVIFFSTATNLVTIDTSSFGGLFIRDRDTDAIELLSRTVSGGDADNFIGEAVEISDDGSRVIFSSLATNMVPNDGNNVQDVFTVANPFRR